MPAPKGRPKPKGSGLKKGQKIAKTLAWEQLGDFITETGAQRLKVLLETADERTFFQYYTLLLEYFKPKLQRSEVKQDGDNVMKIIIEKSITD